MQADLHRAREAAAELLLQQRLYNLSIDVCKLRYDRNIRFDSMQEFCARSRLTMGSLSAYRDLQDGCTLASIRGGKPFYLVLYNGEMANLRRRTFTLAHEIGHIYLDHTDDAPQREVEADCFAAELLMPRILVHRLAQTTGQPLRPEQLCGIFPVSRQAAIVCLRSLKSVKPSYFTEPEFAVFKRFGGLLPSLEGPVVDY